MNAPIAPFSQGLLDHPDLNAFGTLLEFLVSAGKHTPVKTDSCH
jgi:hypothetical protein